MGRSINEKEREKERERVNAGIDYNDARLDELLNHRGYSNCKYL